MLFIILLCSFTAQKRTIFDQYGEEGLKSRGSPSDAGTSYTFTGDPHKIFAEFFGGKDPFSAFGGSFGGGPFQFGGPSMSHSFQFGGDEGMDFTPSGGSAFMGGMKRPRAARQDPPIEYPLGVTLEELFTGCTKKMKISRRVVNPDGTTSPQTKVLTIDIKRGWKAGTKITYAKEGDQSIGRTPADVVFVIQEKPHPLFSRSGNDLHYTANISLRDALCGGKLEIPTIEGGTVLLPLNDIVNPETTKRIPGHGMPLSKQLDQRGDLVVNFKINFPRQLSPTSRSQLSRVLPV